MAKKPDFLFNQAGALPYRGTGTQVEVVLIRSRTTGDWIFPKGVIDPGETPETTAVKEALEEAGVVGELTGGPLGWYEQEKWGGVARIEVYPLLVEELLEDWDERRTRQRQLFSLEYAKQITPLQLRAILEAFEKARQNAR
jgi:phosphohistidine phosphatase